MKTDRTDLNSFAMLPDGYQFCMSGSGIDWLLLDCLLNGIVDFDHYRRTLHNNIITIIINICMYLYIYIYIHIYIISSIILYDHYGHSTPAVRARPEPRPPGQMQYT